MSYFLRGQQVGLRPLRPSDADGPYPDWLNDPEVCSFNSHHVWPYDRELARAYIESVRGSKSDLVLAMDTLADQKHVGNIALQAIHPLYRSADLSILIGQSASWAKGIGAEACRLLVDHGFSALGLNRIACGTTEGNIGMQKLALKLGMREEGRRRSAIWKNGQWLDVIEYGLLASEWVKPEKQKQWSG